MHLERGAFELAAAGMLVGAAWCLVVVDWLTIPHVMVQQIWRVMATMPLSLCMAVAALALHENSQPSLLPLSDIVVLLISASLREW